MLPTPHHSQFIVPRIEAAHQRVRSMIWAIDTEHPLDVCQATPTREHLPVARIGELDFAPVPPAPFVWGRKFDQCWWRVRLPENAGGRYFHWQDMGEATLYVDGVPYQGLDIAHPYCLLPQGVREVLVESICCNTGVWLAGESQGITPKGSEFKGAFLATRNDLAWKVFHDLDVLLNLFKQEYAIHVPKGNASPYGHATPLDSASPVLRIIMRAFYDAMAALDTEGLEAASTTLDSVYNRLRGKGLGECILTGHAHIDLVWLWPERVGEFKAVHSFSTMNRLMEQYPEFRFGYSQPASYEAVARRSPELFREVRQRITNRQWDAEGMTYVECDTQLACGEALLRDFLLGQDGFASLRGKPSRVLWIPDVFGYSGCIPALIRGTGGEFFFTSKMSWSSITRFPFSSFVWRGNDGTEVITHLIHGDGYNGVVEPGGIRSVMNRHLQCDVHEQALYPCGYGDGGGGATETMLERARRVSGLPGLPEVRWGNIETFFDDMKPLASQLPIWSGEMFLEYHRGVHTTHAHLKAAFRACERGLQVREAAHCLVHLGAIPVEDWKRLAFAHFHDYIPGSSILEVYDEGVPELQSIAGRSLQAAATAASSPEGAAAYFNPLPYAVNHLDMKRQRVLRLPPLARVAAESAPVVDVPPVRASRASLENNRVRATFDSAGRILEFSVDGTKAETRAPLGELYFFPEHPGAFDAWDIDRADLALGKPIPSDAEVSVESDALRASVTFSKKITAKSSVVIRYILEAASPVLHIEYDVDWQDEASLLKVAFPTTYMGRNARYGAPFGSALRVQHSGAVADEAKFEAPASRWAAVSDEGGTNGLFVVTEAKYGFGCLDGLLHLSLVRSPQIPGAKEDLDIRDLSSRCGHSDIGQHRIRIAVGLTRPHLPREEQPAALADILYTVPLPCRGAGASCGFLGIEGGNSLIPAWAKPVSAGQWVLRLHETAGLRGTANLLLEKGWRARLADMRETPEEASLADGRIPFGPFQILSLLIRRD
jgi:alpha-mannosidase